MVYILPVVAMVHTPISDHMSIQAMAHPWGLPLLLLMDRKDHMAVLSPVVHHHLGHLMVGVMAVRLRMFCLHIHISTHLLDMIRVRLFLLSTMVALLMNVAFTAV